MVLEGLHRLVGEGQDSRAGLRLGALGLSMIVVGVADVRDLAVEVDVSP